MTTFEEVITDLYNMIGRAVLADTLTQRAKDRWTLEETVGQLLFGKPGRMIGGIWIAGLSDEKAEKFCFNDFTDWLRSTKRRAQTNFRTDLSRFKDLGMIIEIPISKESGDRTIWYARCSSPLWDLFVMADVVIGEAGEARVGERKFYKPTQQRHDRMVGELLEIHESTAERPFRRPKTRCPQPARSSAPARNVRLRGPNGELRCSRCKTWKHEDDFSLRTDRKWLRKSRCKDCMAHIARTRYMSVAKVEALNMARLSFKVGAEDDVIGLTCIDCGQPFRAGEVVHSDGRLHHDRCDQTGTEG